MTHIFLCLARAFEGANASATPNPPPVRFALATCLLSRAALVLVAWLGLTLVPATFDEAHWQYFPDNRWADGWCRWDTGWYYGIADKGYTNLPNLSGERDTNFFPLYPLLMRLATLVTDGDLMYGGLLVSNLAFLLAGLAVYQWAQLKFGETVARRTVVLLCLYPFAFYYGAVYTEALFLACAAGAFLFAERDNWLLAAACASGAAVTRIPGFLVGLALVLLYFEKKRRPGLSALYLLLIPVLPLAHLNMLRQLFGDPLAFLSSNTAWSGHRLGEVLEDFTRTQPVADSFRLAVHGLATVLFGAAVLSCVLAFRRVGGGLRSLVPAPHPGVAQGPVHLDGTLPQRALPPLRRLGAAHAPRPLLGLDGALERPPGGPHICLQPLAARALRGPRQASSNPPR